MKRDATDKSDYSANFVGTKDRVKGGDRFRGGDRGKGRGNQKFKRGK